MNRNSIISSIITLFLSIALSAQEGHTIDNLVEIEIPSLELLMEGARNSPQVEFYNLRMEGQQLNLKSERRRWMEYFSIHASYLYGVMAISTESITGSELPPNYHYSGSAQDWYNAGATIRLPFDRLFDRRNRIRREQIKIEETLQERELWYDEYKLRVIEEYTKAIEARNALRYAIELYTVADAQYKVTQKDYVVGEATAQGLAVAKSAQVTASVQVERFKSELSAALYKLEVMTGIKIISKN